MTKFGALFFALTLSGCGLEVHGEGGDTYHEHCDCDCCDHCDGDKCSTECPPDCKCACCHNSDGTAKSHDGPSDHGGKGGGGCAGGSCRPFCSGDDK